MFNIPAAVLREHVLDQQGVTCSSTQPLFLSGSEEDCIVNWIHDMTDLGWSITDDLIARRIQLYLYQEAFLVVFGDTLSINMPSTLWMNGEFVITNSTLIIINSSFFARG